MKTRRLLGLTLCARPLGALAATLIAIGLSGCATSGAADRSTTMSGLATDGSAAGEASLVTRLGALAPGESLALQPGNSLGGSRATVFEEYIAASGRTCRRVLIDGGRSDERIICQSPERGWEMPRSLETGEHSVRTGQDPIAILDAAALLPSSNATRTVSPVPAGDRSLAPGESLWNFARRTTGRADNWQAIAAANDIDDSRLVAAGRTLEIPAELLLAESE